jgi:hypothetical protein
MEGRKSVPSALCRDFGGGLCGSLKIVSSLDELDAKRTHCGVLLDAVAVRDHYRNRNSVPLCREAN